MIYIRLRCSLIAALLKGDRLHLKTIQEMSASGSGCKETLRDKQEILLKVGSMADISMGNGDYSYMFFEDIPCRSKAAAGSWREISKMS